MEFLILMEDLLHGTCLLMTGSAICLFKPVNKFAGRSFSMLKEQHPSVKQCFPPSASISHPSSFEGIIILVVSFLGMTIFDNDEFTPKESRDF